MKCQVINQPWKMRELGTQQYFVATVPGSVYKDLLENGVMENPFWKDNETKALELMDRDYEYSTSFLFEEGITQYQHIQLMFEGVDTIGDIYFNDILLGSTVNMHRTWTYSIRDTIVSGENRLRVVLHSPTKYIKDEYKKNPAEGTDDAMQGFPLIRKAHYMYGWDWGPHLPDAGIWRDVKIYAYDETKIDNIYIKQQHYAQLVTLDIDIEERLDHNDIDTYYDVHIISPSGEETVFSNLVSKLSEVEQYMWQKGTKSQQEGILRKKVITLPIENPLLWWPNGFGEQPLYEVIVVQKVGHLEMDRVKKRIGLRTMTMHIEEDQWGSSFAHQVNGIDIFAMGADYIPEDNIVGRVTKETTYQLLLQCKSANFNSIRVWGGGYYPNDWFYDICDELGLIVWQDFMFACAVYNLTQDFEENIIHEIKDNILRIRHHACLGLWCGNNEMEMFVKIGLWVSYPSQKADYIKMYEYIIPKLVQLYDPMTFYWPASPSSGGAFDEPNDFNRGDVHYWDVWHNNVPFPEFRKFHFRYLSEFGFQSFPSLKTIETFTDDPRDFNAFSYVMEKHQRNKSANGKIMTYMQQTFLCPSGFDTFVYASQLLQAEAIRYGVEHFRRHRGRCMGAIYWQLNDCWPVVSWASIDYEARWKALHYYAKRFFAPIMVSCAEEGMITQVTHVNGESFDLEKSIHLNIANETRQKKSLILRWEVRENTGVILREESISVEVPELSSIWLEKVYLDEIQIFTQYVSYAIYEGEEILSSGTVIFSLPKYFKYVDPCLSYELEGDDMIISAKAYAKSIEIRNEEDDLLLSDNFFDLNAGSKRVKVMKGSIDSLRLRSVFDIK